MMQHRGRSVLGYMRRGAMDCIGDKI